jgi:CheY-like chemotaxis protein
MGLFVSALKDPNREPESPRILDHLTTSVETLEGLFDALLDVSKLDAGIVRPEIRDFSLQAVLDRIGRECAAEAAGKGLRLRLMPTRAAARSDPGLLERILLNLVFNAIRYTNAGGVAVGCRRRGDALRISVYDTGVGIDPAQFTHIFREFYQIGNPERDRTKGLGLGLAIVDRLARLLNCPLGVVSVPGRGSVFSVTVPRGELASSEMNLPEEIKVIEGNMSGALLVVIDDEAAVLEGMRAVLQQWGCRPLLAGSADAALEQLGAAASQPAAVIADYRLRAGETGTDAIERIRAAYGADIPGVIITGDTAPDRLREAEASGFHLLHKPVRPAKLRALLSFLLSA